MSGVCIWKIRTIFVTWMWQRYHWIQEVHYREKPHSEAFCVEYLHKVSSGCWYSNSYLTDGKRYHCSRYLLWNPPVFHFSLKCCSVDVKGRNIVFFYLLYSCTIGKNTEKNKADKRSGNQDRQIAGQHSFYGIMFFLIFS